jgi:hypothetical protein
MPDTALSPSESAAVWETIPDDIPPDKQQVLFVKATERYLLRKEQRREISTGNSVSQAGCVQPRGCTQPMQKTPSIYQLLLQK